MNKLWNIHTVKYYSGIKRNEQLIHSNTRDYRLCDFLHVTFLGKQNYRNKKKDQWLEMGRDEGAAHGGFLGQ